MLRKLKSLLTLLPVLLLAACGGELNTPGEELRLLATQLAPAFIGETYSSNIRVVGGLSPYSYSLESGSLPPGLSLQGNTIRGVPSQQGRFSFTITVSDANLSKTFREFNLQVSDPPPAELSLNVPNTEMRRSFTLRGEIKNARNLQAFRSLITWDATLFELVPDSLQARRNDIVLFERYEEGRLNIDVAILAASLTGDYAVFELELRPLKASTIEVSSSTEFLASDGGHAFSQTREGRRPLPPTAENPAEPPNEPEEEETP